MSILNYRDRLTILSESNTYLYFKCPVCAGKVGLQKTGRRAGSYWCYTSNCNTGDIWHGVTGYRAKGVEVLDVEDVPVINRVESIALLRINIPYSLPCQRSYYSPLLDTTATETTYIYDDVSVVKRTDYHDEHGTKVKRFLPQYYDNGEWHNGTHYKWLLYNERYLPVCESGNAVTLCEGEKVADKLTSATGYLTLSPPGFGWNDDYLAFAFNRLFMHINGIIYCPDNDEVGVKKLQLIRDIAHKNHMWCEVLEPPNDVNDFADISNEEIEQCLLKYLQKQDQI